MRAIVDLAFDAVLEAEVEAVSAEGRAWAGFDDVLKHSSVL
jgi:hypothetical protein